MKKGVSKFLFVHFGIRNTRHNDKIDLTLEDTYGENEYVFVDNIGSTDHIEEDSDIDVPIADAIDRMIITNAQKYSIVLFTTNRHVCTICPRRT
jgi:PIN domain nuclease of toxin-antitoxin system